MKWIERSLEYRQCYFMGAVMVISFSLGISIGIPIFPMHKWATVLPASIAIICFGLIGIKVMPYLYEKLVLLEGAKQ